MTEVFVESRESSEKKLNNSELLRRVFGSVEPELALLECGNSCSNAHLVQELFIKTEGVRKFSFYTSRSEQSPGIEFHPRDKSSKIYYDFWDLLGAHICFSRSVNCGDATMENGFQVTILDLEALKSWNLDLILI